MRSHHRTTGGPSRRPCRSAQEQRRALSARSRPIQQRRASAPVAAPPTRATARVRMQAAADRAASNHIGDSRNRGKGGQPAWRITAPDRRGRGDAHLWRDTGPSLRPGSDVVSLREGYPVVPSLKVRGGIAGYARRVAHATEADCLLFARAAERLGVVDVRSLSLVMFAGWVACGGARSEGIRCCRRTR